MILLFFLTNLISSSNSISEAEERKTEKRERERTKNVARDALWNRATTKRGGKARFFLFIPMREHPLWAEDQASVRPI